MKKTLIIVAALILILICTATFFTSKQKKPDKYEWGITFSHTHAQYMGYDWKTMYLDMLNDLQPKKLRLMAYWESIESERGKYNFGEVAQMVDEAQRRNIDVILVVGHKQPRWPECHHPGWYNDLDNSEKEQAQLEYVKNTVAYFKQFSAIKIWQVENEALFAFGEDCPTTPTDLIKKEMQVVRDIDSRPILLTDSGELGFWLPVAKLNPDIFGSTMYRVVHSPRLGYFKYPLPPQFFRGKAGFVKTFSNVDKMMGVELQAEPWFTDTDVFHTDLKTQNALMNTKIFNEYVNYAKKAGFEENYLWGVEWWYWMAHEKGDWGMWNAAKQTLST